MKIQKLNGLIATYKCSASTDAEKSSSRKLVCKMIEKKLNCKRWISANIFIFLADGDLFLNKYGIEVLQASTGDNNPVNTIVQSISKLGFKYKIDNYQTGNKYIIKI